MEYGGKIYRITARSHNPVLFKKELRAFFQKHGKDYDILWMNDNSLANVDYLKEAKKVGIPHIIMHCHNDRDMSSRAQAVLHRLHRIRIESLATDYWACSDEAADYCFTGPARKKAVVIKNAIDLTEKIFDENKRDAFRSRFNLEDRFVIGNVGRLHFQKNQMFMLEIMKKIVEKNDAPVSERPILILIGTGPDEEILKSKIKEYELENYVSLLGRQEDIQAALSAMDVFLFPSVFEGLGIAALEAELNGLPVLASDTIPEVTGVTENYQVIPLESGADKWAEKVLDNISARISSDEASEALRNAGYDIKTAANTLHDRFTSVMEG